MDGLSTIFVSYIHYVQVVANHKCNQISELLENSNPDDSDSEYKKFHPYKLDDVNDSPVAIQLISNVNVMFYNIVWFSRKL